MGLPDSDHADPVALGVSVMSTDKAGVPRLIRAIIPRQGAAGMSAADAARDHVQALAPLWVNKQQPMALTEVSHQDLRNGSTVVRLAQTVDGVPVHNGQIGVLLHADRSFAAASGTLVPAATRPHFVSTASAALGRALDTQLGASRIQAAITEVGEANGWKTLEVATTSQVEVTEARARRELVNINGVLKEAWNLEILSNTFQDGRSGDPSIPEFSAHRYLVSDSGLKVIQDEDLVKKDAFVYRVFAETTGNRRPLDSPLQSFAPHPTGVPDGSAPPFITPNLVVMDGFNHNPAGTFDSWLASNATTTSGNNAEAFADLNASAVFDAGDIKPEVKSGRVLNYTYHTDQGPLSSVDQSKASAVSAFYLVNWMHDWWYDSGFTEAAGNAQQSNYGRGGVEGDPILIQAQAGANAGLRNNADMATPLDGARPHMRMFLWTAGTVTSVITPTATLPSEAFSAPPHEFNFTGDVVAVTDGTAPTNDGCQPATNNISGKIALVFFSGACGSAVTVNTLKAAGAAAVIIADPASDDPRAFAGSAAANIPGLAVGNAAGQALLAALASGPLTVTLTSGVSGPERDGDFDYTVVAHEWGHYLHHRLASCGAAQCGGMSEGWGDFNALMMMLREGDNRDGVYAVAPYAIDNGFANFAYFGLRRFPYSRDRTKNDLSFRHISDGVPLPTTTPGFPGGANSEVHNTGEIWATMMWEVLNVLADEHGVTVARRRMSDYVVAGLQITPPDATFTEARDALLAAASALDTDDMILMAAAFAGRGAGSCAVSPAVDDATNSGVVESGTLAAKFGVGGLSLTDDGISCDKDGYLDRGETGNLKVTVANNGILAAENVTITATTTATGVKLGAPIKLNLLQPFSAAALSIPVTVQATAPLNTLITINVHIAGSETCDPQGVDVPLTVRIGADDVPNASKIDNAETKISAWTPTGALATSLWGRVRVSGNTTFFGVDAGFPSDTSLTSPALQVSTTEPFVVKIKHAFALEGDPLDVFFDGGMIEVSLNGGATWSDVTAFGVNPGYSGPLFIGSDNPLGGRQAFSGVSPGFPALNALTMNFGTVFAGLSVMIRFRIGTDAAVAFAGWLIDDIDVSGITNTPFPVLVPETQTCTAKKGPDRDNAGGVLAVRSAPSVSLADFDANACSLENAE